jgi:hypothetical protein
MPWNCTGETAGSLGRNRLRRRLQQNLIDLRRVQYFFF